jgi:multicomponent K+:H+ antiporter subunit G
MSVTLLEIAVSACVLIGASFALIGSIGLVRLPDFYLRLHGPAKATTLGVGGTLIGSMLFFSHHGDGISLHELLITVFLFITAPVSAHIVAKAALHIKVPCIARTRGKPWKENEQ